MVFQMPYAGKARVFAASSEQNQEEARRELRLWANNRGYRPTHDGRTFTTYHGDALPREWVLLEQRPGASA